MDASQSVRVAFETARLRLAEIRSVGKGAKQSAYEIACRLSARTLGVDRVSVWCLEDNNRRLACLATYLRAQDRYAGGPVILRDACPDYFEALLSRRVVVADDALNDIKTRQLEPYLRAHAVGAILDAPLYRDGVIVGVVCHEHCGGSRRWTAHEAEFASAVADMLTILLEQAELVELRAALEADRDNQLRAEKMSALQRLARIVAHDLNNVLMVAMARTELIQRGAEPPAASGDVNEVLAYGAKLVRQLSDFCADQPNTQSVDFGRMLAKFEPALRALMGREVALVLNVSGALAPAALPALEAEQLILNLCMNARDAIRPDGQITLTLSPDPATQQLVLEVRDDGVGMDEQTQGRIFEPYFTTKKDHTGVGLMAVYGIVKRAGGSITLDSRLGGGTTFRITLPTVTTSAGGQELPWAF